MGKGASWTAIHWPGAAIGRMSLTLISPHPDLCCIGHTNFAFFASALAVLQPGISFGKRQLCPAFDGAPLLIQLKPLLPASFPLTPRRLSLLYKAVHSFLSFASIHITTFNNHLIQQQTVFSTLPSTCVSSRLSSLARPSLLLLFRSSPLIPSPLPLRLARPTPSPTPPRTTPPPPSSSARVCPLISTPSRP